jgi:ABC-2 type transport system permease protein
MNLSKYTVTVKLELTRLMEYRINFFLRLSVNTLVPLIIKYFLLTSLFRLSHQTDIAGYSEREMVIYTLWATLIVLLVEIRSTIENVAEDIRLGRITRYLLYPISMFEICSFQFVAALIVQMICFVFSAALLHFYVDGFVLHMETPEFWLAMTFVMLGSVFWYLVHYTIGLFTFWLDEIWPFFIVFQMVARFLSGSPFPMEMFPDALRQINYFLPFEWFLYVPAQLFSGRLTLTSELQGMSLYGGLLVMLGWTVLICVANKFFWKAGIRKYAGAGM